MQKLFKDIRNRSNIKLKSTRRRTGKSRRLYEHNQDTKNYYNITDVHSQKKYSIFSKQGQDILKKYLKSFLEI